MSKAVKKEQTPQSPLVNAFQVKPLDDETTRENKNFIWALKENAASIRIAYGRIMRANINKAKSAGNHFYFVDLLSVAKTEGDEETLSKIKKLVKCVYGGLEINKREKTVYFMNELTLVNFGFTSSKDKNTGLKKYHATLGTKAHTIDAKGNEVPVTRKLINKALDNFLWGLENIPDFINVCFKAKAQGTKKETGFVAYLDKCEKMFDAYKLTEKERELAKVHISNMYNEHFASGKD